MRERAKPSRNEWALAATQTSCIGKGKQPLPRYLLLRFCLGVSLTAALSSCQEREGGGAGSGNAAKVFNAQSSARAGDIIGLQGVNFDASTRVHLDRTDGSSATFPIVNRVGSNWIAVQLPTPLPQPFVIRVSNQHGASEALRINAARPQFLDTTQLVPGGRFRIAGQNLISAGRRPVVMVNGKPAEVDMSASDENMLVVAAPRDAVIGAHAEITCDNGDGTGATLLKANASITQGGPEDPLGLGVGWASGFIFANRLQPSGAVCDGATDDTAAISGALSRVAAAGGAIVTLPAGICRIAGTIELRSNTILRGAGADRTTIQYEGNYPIFAAQLDLVGLENLTLRNIGAVEEGMLWRDNTRSFIRRVEFDLAKSRQWFLTSNKNFIFDQNVIRQVDSYDLQNPYRFDASSGLIFTNNRSINVNGSPTFQRVRDSIFLNNVFTRDARSQFEAEIVAHHRMVMDFSFRVAIIGNRFDVVNGPIANTKRNDGETLMTEGGGPFRTEYTGLVRQATANSLVDPDASINTDPFGSGFPDNLGVAIVSGTGAGQTRRIITYKAGKMTIDRPWELIPTQGSRYSTFVWGLEQALIKRNVLIDNPRGIWLYQSSVRDVVISENEIRNGGGIFLRSYQNLATKTFTLQANITIADNLIVNDSGRWMSHIVLANVASDPPIAGVGRLGVGFLGIDVRRNRLVANMPNVTSATEDYASTEGFTNLVRVESPQGGPNASSLILGTIFQGNSCDNCKSPFTIGTGSAGTVLADNSPGKDFPGFVTDIRFFPSETGGATDTFIR